MKKVLAFGAGIACPICRGNFANHLKEYPPQLKNRDVFLIWTCMIHNLVNAELKKKFYPCTLQKLLAQYGPKNGAPMPDF